MGLGVGADVYWRQGTVNKDAPKTAVPDKHTLHRPQPLAGSGSPESVPMADTESVLLSRSDMMSAWDQVQHSRPACNAWNAQHKTDMTMTHRVNWSLNWHCRYKSLHTLTTDVGKLLASAVHLCVCVWGGDGSQCVSAFCQICLPYSLVPYRFVCMATHKQWASVIHHCANGKGKLSTQMHRYGISEHKSDRHLANVTDIIHVLLLSFLFSFCNQELSCCNIGFNCYRRLDRLEKSPPSKKWVCMYHISISVLL